MKDAIRSCASGKRGFDSEVIAEEALQSIRRHHDYTSENGPRGIYKCGMCHQFHFTSADTGHIKSGSGSDVQSEARYWEEKFKSR